MHRDAPFGRLHATAFLLAVALATGIGAAVGSSVANPRGGSLPPPIVPAERAAPVDRDRDADLAIASLTQELRRLGERLDRVASRPLAEAPGDALPPAPPDAGTWIVALERAAYALTSAANRVAGPGSAGVTMPEEPTRMERVLPLLTGDEAAFSVQHAFWSVQRVLDTYGRPSAVHLNGLHYDAEGGGVVFHLDASGYVRTVSVTRNPR